MDKKENVSEKDSTLENIKKRLGARKCKSKSRDGMIKSMNDEIIAIKKHAKEEERRWARAAWIIRDGDNEEDKTMLSDYFNKYMRDGGFKAPDIIENEYEIIKEILRGNNEKLKNALEVAYRAVVALENEQKQKEEAID